MTWSRPKCEMCKRYMVWPGEDYCGRCLGLRCESIKANFVCELTKSHTGLHSMKGEGVEYKWNKREFHFRRK